MHYGPVEALVAKHGSGQDLDAINPSSLAIHSAERRGVYQDVRLMKCV
jgi:hypothetical protein